MLLGKGVDVLLSLKLLFLTLWPYLMTFGTGKACPVSATILITTGSGGVGLNITAASGVTLLEPRWNISAESQAIGRAWRQGQDQAVTAIRPKMIQLFLP